MLTRLYSDTNLLLKPFCFQSGINIILGKYSQERERTGINGIGKSTLIRLIDYAFLSDSTETKFLQSKYNFLREEKHSITLELILQGKTHFIKRTFGKNDPVLFGNSVNTLEAYSKQELKTILNNKLFPINDQEVAFQGERFRTLMEFFIKDDLNYHERVDPLKFSKGVRNQTDIALYNFFLMGLPTISISNYETHFKEYTDTNSGLIRIEKKVKTDQDKSLEELKSERIKLEQKITSLRNSLQEHNYLENAKEIEKKLIETTSSINEHLKQYHAFNKKLTKIRESYRYCQSFDTDNIRKLYNEACSTFGDVVSKTLNEIISFKKEILENRNKFLISKERELKKTIDTILEKVSSLEEERSKLYKILDDKGALASIKNAFQELITEKTKLAADLKILADYDDLQDKLSNLQVDISEAKRDITNSLRQNKGIIDEFTELFIEMLKSAISIDENDTSGYFAISPKPNSRKNQLPFKIEVEIPKKDALGQSRLKLVAYDLMIFLKNIKENRIFPRFLIHDGVYHGIEIQTKIKALNYLYHMHNRYPYFQYLVTFNEDEIRVPEIIEGFDFRLDDLVIAEFTDSPEGMIFKRDFK